MKQNYIQYNGRHATKHICVLNYMYTYIYANADFLTHAALEDVETRSAIQNETRVGVNLLERESQYMYVVKHVQQATLNHVLMTSSCVGETRLL